ncbi:MAG: tetratricopeptide repeat protein [Chitinophagaceae bacterium]
MKILSTIILFLTGAPCFGQSPEADKSIRAGNDFYKQEEYNRAVIEYNKAVEIDPANNTAKFNKANAVYKQDQKVEAVKIYANVAKDAEGKDLKSKAFYNKGVILSDQKNLEESIEAYKNALRNDPADKEARENLQKALLELKKKEPPKKEDQQKKKQQQDQQKKQQQPKINPKEADQRLKLLEQKEKEVQQRLQKEKAKTGGSAAKDW